MHGGHNKYAFSKWQNQNLKKESTPTHTPSLPQNGPHTGPNLSKLCHPLAREGEKKNAVSNTIWCFDLSELCLVQHCFYTPKKLLF